MPDVCSKVGCLLYDVQSSVRELAVETLVSLYEIFGVSMLEELSENENIRPSQMKSVREAIHSSSQHQGGYTFHQDMIKSNTVGGVAISNYIHDVNDNGRADEETWEGKIDRDEEEYQRPLNHSQGPINFATPGGNNFEHSDLHPKQSSRGNENQNNNMYSSSSGRTDTINYEAERGHFNGGDIELDSQRDYGRISDSGLGSRSGSNRNGPSREEKKSGPSVSQKGLPLKGRMSLAGIEDFPCLRYFLIL